MRDGEKINKYIVLQNTSLPSPTTKMGKCK